SLSKKNLFVGEQTVLTMAVAVRPQSSVGLTNEGFAGFINRVEKNFGDKFAITNLLKGNIPAVMEQIDGRPYQVFSVHMALVPLTSGNIAIQPIPFEYVEQRQVRRQARDPFDDFFGGAFFGNPIQRIPRSVSSNGLTISVSATPQPAPPNFSGAVGQFSLEAQADPQQISAGDAITLKISLRGNTRPGNVEDVKLPALADCDVFTPEKQTSVDTTPQGLTTRKGYKFLIIPRVEGALALPPVTYCYFDPIAKTYKTLSAVVRPVTVLKGKAGAKEATRYLTQEDITLVGRDIRYIHTGVRLRRQSPDPYKNPLLYLLFPLPFIIAGLALLYKLQTRHRRRNAGLIVRSRAYGKAARGLALIAKEAPTLSAG
ncbi:MAG: BatD family protein, partial [Chitinivibrionales bacterium]|nr:BatD family protein [Chitinivibrionales bacterium]